MLWPDAALWTLAIVLFVVGDWATTRYGLAQPGVVERNPLARWAIERFGVTVSLFLLKSSALLVALAGYAYASGAASTESYRLLFPVVIVLAGTVTTVRNLQVLVSHRG
ncbi:MAG: hypothetical protein J07HX64_01200 [halophilic archaeon J07HX64]|jgi:hypothetical protein|nr:MAG: hypothetical protein J07HX64_01200 [halophilic archaeon J07HX64]